MERHEALRGPRHGGVGAGQPWASAGEHGHGHHGGRGGRGEGRRPGPGGGGHHDGRGGRGGRGGARVGRGDVRAATLLLLTEQPLHGYQVIQLINERSGGVWRPSPGSVYPALQLLEDEGLVRAEQDEGRRVFHLTEAGQAYVEQRRGDLTAARDAVTEAVDAGAVELRDLAGQVGLATEGVLRAGAAAQVAAARAVLVGARRQLYLILADDGLAAGPPVDQPTVPNQGGGLA